MKARSRVAVVVAFRAPAGRPTRFVTGSIAVHGALLAGILVIPATRHRAAPIEDAMVVALAGPIAVSAPARGTTPPRPAVAPPKPVAAAPKEAHTVREVPVPTPKPKLVKVKPAPEKPVEPEAPPAPEESPQDGPQDAAPGGAAGSPTGAVTATVGGGDSALGWYGAAVKAALESAWIKPYLEDAQGTASVVVTFAIARDGTTRDIRIQQSSGIPALDRSAQRAVLEATPFPLIPPTWTDDTIPVTMRFDLSPEPR